MQDKIFVTQSSMPSYEEYISAIKPLWNSHLLTNMGEYHNILEDRLKSYFDVPYVSLMVNGHMALEMSINAFNFPAGSEIITTPFTFVSTTHAIVRNGLIPVFCDVKQDDGTIDETKIEDLITEKTAAILPVHVYGNVCNIEAIEKIALKYKLLVIYDAAHAFGVRYKNKGIGNFGDASCFSFHATKVFNTIEGGAVTFSNSEMYQKLLELKNFGISNEELVADVGVNAKMNEFSAIMGLCNLNHIDEVLETRKEKYNYYKNKLNKIKGIEFFCDNPDVKKNYSYFPILISDKFRVSRNELYEYLADSGIYSRKYFYPLTSDQVCFKNKYKNANVEIAKDLAKRILVLPFFEKIDKQQIDYIIDKISGE